MGWMEFYKPNVRDEHFADAIFAAMQNCALKSNSGQLYRGYLSGQLTDIELYDELAKELGLRIIEESRERNGDIYSIAFCDEWSFARITPAGGDIVNIQLASTKWDNFDHVQKTLSKYCAVPSQKVGRVWMLTQTYNGLAFESIGIGGAKLIRENYEDDVLVGYDHFCADAGAIDPCGRLCVIIGPPGGGKTHLIRGMMHADVGNFAFIPPQLVSQISGPQIIKAVKDFTSNYGRGRSLILTIEDGDEVVVPRAADNMSSISTLLNASEGILGQLMNVRIVVTTNADVKKLDRAIERPGRLCARIDVGKLSTEKATAVLRRLVPSAEPMGNATLAEIYREARRLGWSSDGKSVKPLDVKDNDRKIGFGNG